MKAKWCVLTLIFAWVTVGCGDQQNAANKQPGQLTAVGKLELSSSAFESGQPIPAKYTCDGQDVSPPLKWTGAPQSTKSFALICQDPDAPGGTWTHWVVYNLPSDVTEISEGMPTIEKAAGGPVQAKNDFARVGYGGPCPPPGPVHHYQFRLFALDSRLDTPAGSTRKQVEDAMKGHVVGQGELVGTYVRN
ncbi:MAG TPA: YbhB/YbcL family Raf kinase inhibitor-like protein [Blastocatellia bacterium]|nr:YbhB/YbcL family Raf kinase inhibitor-like protein [Blastocatellia bacterium]